MRKTVFYKWLSAFLTWFGKIMVRLKPPKVKAKHIRKAIEAVRPGDIVMRRFDCYLDSAFIGGPYTHAGIYVGCGQVVHMMAEGKLEDDIIDFVKNADGFCVLRPRYLKEVDAIAACLWAKKVNAKYDFLFHTSEEDSFYYCFEFCAFALMRQGLNTVEYWLKDKKVILSSNLLKLGRVVYSI